VKSTGSPGVFTVKVTFTGASGNFVPGANAGIVTVALSTTNVPGGSTDIPPTTEIDCNPVPEATC